MLSRKSKATLSAACLLAGWSATAHAESAADIAVEAAKKHAGTTRSRGAPEG